MIFICLWFFYMMRLNLSIIILAMVEPSKNLDNSTAIPECNQNSLDVSNNSIYVEEQTIVPDVSKKNYINIKNVNCFLKILVFLVWCKISLGHKITRSFIGSLFLWFHNYWSSKRIPNRKVIRTISGSMKYFD